MLNPRIAWLLPVALLLSCCPPGSDKPLLVNQSCYLYSDYQQLPRPRLVPRRSTFRPAFRKLLDGLLVGVGDRYRQTLTNADGEEEEVIVHEWAQQQGAPINAQAIWLTRDWAEGWVSTDDLQRMADSGVVPVLMLYYFADDISRAYVLEHRQDWFFYLMKVASLAAIDAPVMVVLEPEFNDEANPGGTLISSWPGFNEIVIDGIYLLRSMAPNLLVGICPGDFGREDLEPAIGEIAEYSDFIAFQEMRASTRPSRVSDNFEDVTGRSLGYAEYLHNTFDKPVLLAYVAVSTFDDQKDSWQWYQADILNHLFASHRELRDRGIFGLLYFSLFDDPEHEGYFGEAEKHFGLVDAAGQPKAGWEAFVKNLSNLQSMLASGW